jgi:hypothetical protein
MLVIMTSIRLEEAGMVDRDMIHRAVEDLTPESLDELGEFIAYLKYKEQHKGAYWFERLYNLYAPVRRALEGSGMTEDEINTVLDEALEEVRRDRYAQSRP